MPAAVAAHVASVMRVMVTNSESMPTVAANAAMSCACAWTVATCTRVTPVRHTSTSSTSVAAVSVALVAAHTALEAALHGTICSMPLVAAQEVHAVHAVASTQYPVAQEVQAVPTEHTAQLGSAALHVAHAVLPPVLYCAAVHAVHVSGVPLAHP